MVQILNLNKKKSVSNNFIVRIIYLNRIQLNEMIGIRKSVTVNIKKLNINKE